MVINGHHPFPHLPTKSLNVILVLQREGERVFGLVPIPKALPDFFCFNEPGLRYILTEQLVLEYAGRLFHSYQVLEKHVISVTRNADISPEDEDYDVGEDFREHMIKVLKKRNRLAHVRLEIQGEPSDEVIQYLCRRLQLRGEQVFRCKSPLAMGYVYALESRLPAGERRRAVLSALHPPVERRPGAEREADTADTAQGCAALLPISVHGAIFEDG